MKQGRRILGMRPSVLLVAAVAGLALGYILTRRKAAAAAEPLRYAPSGQPLAIFIAGGGVAGGETERVYPLASLPFLTGGTPGGLPHGQPGPGRQSGGMEVLPGQPSKPTDPAPTVNLAQPSGYYRGSEGPRYYVPPAGESPGRLPEVPIPGAAPVAT